MTDLLVIGDGLAATMAALEARTVDPEARVRVLRPETDRFDWHSGTIDVLGVTDTGEASDSMGVCNCPFDAIEDLPESHPYRVLDHGTVSESVAVFDDYVDYAGTDRNVLTVTNSGSLHPTSRYPQSVGAGIASRQEPMALIGFESVPEFDASYLATTLSEQLPYDVSGTTVSLPGTVTEYPVAPTIATAFDEDTPPSDPVGVPALDMDSEQAQQLTSIGADESPPESFRGPVIDRIKPELDTESRIGFPAVLGEQQSAAIHSAFESAFDASVFEVPIGPPSMLGRRFEKTLLDTLESHDVGILEGDVTGVQTDDDEVTAVTTDATELAVDSVVLATGDLRFGGLTASRTGIREPRFDCPVVHEPSRAAWTGPTIDATHPFASSGLSIDGDCRPVDSTDRPVYDNLFVAGSLIGGHDYIRQGATDGVAIHSGVISGRLAVE